MSTSFSPIQTAVITWHDDIPYAPAFDDVYFSKAGGLEEAMHVFIEGNRLPERWQGFSANGASSFVIGETGFGSGLNFLATWVSWKKYAPSSATLHFISCEKHPLTHDDLARCLRSWPSLHDEARALLEAYPVLTPGFHRLSFDEGRVQLTLILSDVYESYEALLSCGDLKLEHTLCDHPIDAWFFDGFSPAKNKAMWDAPVFSLCSMLSREGTTFATFSSAGVVKEGLRAAGFSLKKTRGHGQKREMLVGEWERPPSTRSWSRHTPWHMALPSSPPAKRALVVGAGLAGCFTAHALARRGWSVTLIDRADEVGAGASGNKAAILYPQLSAYVSPLNTLMLSAYLFACRTYQRILKTCPIGELSGLMQLAFNEKERAMQHKLQSWLYHYPSLGRLVEADEASSLTGIPLETGGLFIPNAGWMDSLRLCQWLRETPGIQWVANRGVSALVYERGEWHANDDHAPVLVMATGYEAMQFSQTAHLPLKAMRGQMTMIEGNAASAQLKIPLCAERHVLPLRDGRHAFGATYTPLMIHNHCHSRDDEDNLAQLNALPTDLAWSNVIAGQWAGVRAATPDYLPLVGPVAEVALFKEQFKGLKSDANRFIPSAGAYYPGLYVCAGFGSRGICTIPFCADYLASFINQEPCGLPRPMRQALSPARFLRREIVRLSSLAI